VVYIPGFVSDQIAQYIATIRPDLLSAAVSPKDQAQPLILNERGRAYDRTALYRRVVRILTEAGLGQRASVQLLRHTYGYLAYLRSSGNLLFVQRQLGHSHPMVTAVYAQFVKFSYAALANQVGGQKPREMTATKNPVRNSILKKKG
jgi:site-specific recombinase XerD